MSYLFNRRSTFFVCFLCLIAPGMATIAQGAEALSGIVSSENEAPLTNVLVELADQKQSFRTTTGEDGTFRIELPSGFGFPARLMVSARGFKPSDLRIDSPNQPVTIVLETSPLFSGEVEVTTNRATIGETPVTVTNVGEEEIARNNWGQDVPMLLQHVPGFYAYNDNGQGMGYSYFFLRGFDMRRTSVSINGVPLNDAESHGVYFVDLADFLSTTGDIQVQRGVGTNLYGGSAIGGAVDLRTRAPLTERRLRVSASGGSWDTRRFDIEFDSGLVDDSWATTFRYSRIESDGYRDQSWLEAWNYYATVTHFGKNTTTKIVLFGGPEDTHLAYEGITQRYLNGEVTGDERVDRRYNPLSYPGEVDNFFQPHYQLVHSWQATQNLVVNNTLYFFEGDGYYKQFKQDAWMPQYNLEPFPGAGGEIIDSTDLIRKRSVDEWDAGWVPTIEWQHGEGRGSLQAGAALRLHKAHHFGETVWAATYPPNTPPDQRYYDYRVDKQTLQPFVQETWRTSDTVLLYGGVTWTSHHYDMHDDKLKDVSFDTSFSYLLPRIGISLTPSEQWSMYGNVSRGGREPAFRDIYDPQDYWFGDEPHDLEAEELTDFELGTRHTWATGYANVNLYYLDFDNAIVWAGGLDSDGLPITSNGAKTTHHGVELEAAWSPVPRFGGRITATYNSATFADFNEYGWDGTYQDYSGNRIAGVPEWLGSLELSGGWGPVDLLVSFRYVGDFYLDNTEDNRKNPDIKDDPNYIASVNDAFTSVDLGAKFALGEKAASLVGARQAEITLRVNNVFDKLYTTFGYVWGPEPTWIPGATRSVYTGLSVDW